MEQTLPTFDLNIVGNDEVGRIGFYDGKEYIEFIKEGEDDDVVWRFLQEVKLLKVKVVYSQEAQYCGNKFILDCLMRHEQRIVANSALMSVKWENASVHFKDSNSLLKMDLKDACILFNVPYEIGTDTNLTMVGNRLKRDVVSLSVAYTEFVHRLFTVFNLSARGGPGETLALTSLRVFEMFHDLDEISINKRMWGEVRQALYATRNEVYNRYGENLEYFDMRSMYPSCYGENVPTGNLSWIAPNLSRGTLAMARVSVPEEWQIGPLPVYCNNNFVFPVGTFEGWWDVVELRYAKELGCKVRLIKQLEAEETSILKEFGDFMCKLRDQEDVRLGQVWKQIAILLTGKFAQSRPYTYLRHISVIEDPDGWEPISIGSPYFLGLQKEQRYTNARPAVTMRIRALARVKHHRMLMSVLEQGGEPYYCDTDSIFCTGGLDMPVGPEPGELKLEDTIQRAYFIMNKFYAYIDDKSRLRKRTAGFREPTMKEYQFKALLDGGQVGIETGTADLSGLRDIAKNGHVIFNGGRRSIRRPEDGQNRIIEGNATRPFVLDIKKERLSGNIYYKGGL